MTTHTVSPNDPPVTITVIRQVKPGSETEFEKLISQVSQEAARFTGHLGTNLFRPQGNSQEYRIIYKFDCMSHFHQWETSKIRAGFYVRINTLLLKAPQTQVFTGLETWFELPEQGAVSPPPRYKMAIISWLAIYPLVILILEILNPFLVHLPIPARAAVMTLIAIPCMTYWLMPRMSQWFSCWLYPRIPEGISTHAD